MAKQKKVIIDGTEIDIQSDDLKVGITYQISEIRSLDTRKNSRTTTIDIPATAANKKTFGFPEDWNAADPIDQTTKPIGSVEVEGTTLIKGFAKVEAAITENKLSHYKLKVLGDNGDWRERIKDLKLSDLDYSSDDHTLDYATVAASWTVNSALRNYVYDLIDRGKFTGKSVANGVDGSGVNIEDCFPAISFSSIINKIFNGIGYTVSSSFLSSTTFTKKYLPFTNAVFKHEDDWGDDKIFKAVQDVTTGSYINYSKGAAETSRQFGLTFANDTTNDGSDLLDLWKLRNDNLLYAFPFSGNYKTYKAVASCGHKFRYQLSYIMTGTTTPGGTVYFNIYKKAVGSMTKVLVHQHSIPWSISASDIDVTTDYLDIEVGDTVWLELDISFSTVTTGAATFRIADHNPAGNKYSYFQLVGLEGPFPIATGHTVEMNANLPDIGQLEWLQGIKDEWNLMFYPDVETRTIYIEPRDDFYSGTQRDWSSKIDRSKPVTIEYLGDNYTKRLRYKFKEDSKDAYVAEWNKQNEDSYGSHEATLSNVFSKDERTDIENKLFAATWMDYCPDPMVGLKTVKIPRMWTDVVQPPISTSFAPRILHYEGLVALPATDEFNMYVYDKSLATPVQYPYPQSYYPRFYFYGEATGEENLGYDSTSNAHGSFQKYYAGTHKILNDGRLITAYFYFKDVDIANFDFREPVYVEVEGNGSFFEVQSIEDFDPDSLESTPVKLIKRLTSSALPTLTTLPKKKIKPKASSIISLMSVKVVQAAQQSGTKVYTAVNGCVIPVLYADINNNLTEVTTE